MALQNCKECNHEISTDAKICPNCGAKQGPKQYSLGTLVAVVFIGWLIYNTFFATDDKPSSRSPNSSNTVATPTKAASVPVLPARPKLKSEGEYRGDSNQICAEKWTKRGVLDQRMYSHCLEGQTEGYSKLEEYQQYADQDWYAGTSFPYCVSKWTQRGVSDTRMISHCLDQELDGIKDVMYYRTTYGETEVNKVAGRGLAKFKSWNMAAYEVKKRFD